MAFHNFKRRVKLSYFFRNKTNLPSALPYKFNGKSNWIPPDNKIPPEMHQQFDQLEERTSGINQSINPPSRSNYIKQADINSLRNDCYITIKPADKGKAVVIMDTTHYITEVNRQLQDDKFYREIDSPVYPTVTQKYNEILFSIRNTGLITYKQFNYLKVPAEPKSRKFYLLPKIHKNKDCWSLDGLIPPGRPIVADCDSDSYRIAEYIDYFLGPIATKHPSYIKDTTHFIETISNYKPEPHHLLITLDVDSLYTNIHNPDGIKAVQTAFIAHPQPNRPDKQLLLLLDLSLKNNDFIFRNQWYLQISGTAMGKKFAPNYANIFLAHWETTALAKCPLLPTCFLRYLDDIFIIWPHSRSDFTHFFHVLNTHHPSIKLKSTIDQQSTNFLDVTIFKGPNYENNHQLDTKVYFKPTDTHRLLHAASYHPKHVFSGIIKSQILRYHRICNNPLSFQNAVSTLFKSLSSLGYSRRFLRYMKNKTIREIPPHIPVVLPPLQPETSSGRCNLPGCSLCETNIDRTTHILDPAGQKHYFNESMTCQTNNLIYLLQCELCSKKYVGHTPMNLIFVQMTIHREVTHRLATPMGTHFGGCCPAFGYRLLIFTPLEKITQLNNRNIEKRLKFWTTTINTTVPVGLNPEGTIPSVLPIVLPYTDFAFKYIKAYRKCYKYLYLTVPGMPQLRIIAAYTRNRSLRDQLVSSVFKD